ncbi:MULTISPECIES: thiosulfate sulfurtransferase GlpE [Gammaproteobacteria]|uniref:thiosulfate sulfurtransferase GlpE n=1 Tax=Gammaproteobacteria TaxID=1236 RepID=UPI000DCF7B16|nr:MULTISPECIES: thiosulfate sulfurtransferase GlpE [Gammaproteobacteria]RTE86467.1 thiosulfate sulfurtransferase GlpE [Aliidiomarina sp. B3213]TCZ90978.1 thiosulfate sulfurtransferase GlpE [Lysobacter sp. N42]
MSEMQHIQLEDARARVRSGDCVLADIRDPRSFSMGHVESAYSLNNDNIKDFLAECQGKAVIVACYHGVSSQGAAQFIAAQGIEEVYSLDGGMTAWATQYPEDMVKGE